MDDPLFSLLFGGKRKSTAIGQSVVSVCGASAASLSAAFSGSSVAPGYCLAGFVTNLAWWCTPSSCGQKRNHRFTLNPRVRSRDALCELFKSSANYSSVLLEWPLQPSHLNLSQTPIRGLHVRQGRGARVHAFSPGRGLLCGVIPVVPPDLPFTPLPDSANYADRLLRPADCSGRIDSKLTKEERQVKRIDKPV